MRTVTVLSGQTGKTKQEEKFAQQLKVAIGSCKTLPYAGIAAAPDEPVGLLVIYHANSVPPLIVDSFIFNREPNYVILRKTKLTGIATTRREHGSKSIINSRREAQS